MDEQNRSKTGWSTEWRPPEDVLEETYPKRTWYNGAKSGVSIILGYWQMNQDYLCKVPVPGFRVKLNLKLLVSCLIDIL